MRTVAAVIVTYNNEEMLERLLRDLAGQRSLPHEVFVIDNSVNDRAAWLVREKFPYMHYTGFHSNKGSAGGYYEGIKQAAETNELIWLLDDDVRVPAESLENLLKGLESMEQKYKIGVVRSWCSSQCLFSKPRKMDSFAWRGTLIPRRIVQEIGLPMKDYFLYCDDTEYAMRIAAAGYSMYWIPDSLVLEQRRYDKKKLQYFGVYTRVYEDKAKLYYAFRNQINLYLTRKMWFPLARTVLYALKVCFLIVFSDTGDNRSGKLAAIVKGLSDGAKGVLGKSGVYTPM